MKIFIVILALFFIISSCSETENLSQSSATEKPRNVLSQPPNREIILEVISNFEGSLFYIKGEILNFRLYGDGLAQFDDIPLESTTGKQHIAEEVRDRKQIKISEAELTEIKNILSSKEFGRLKSKYEKIESSCDAIPEVIIKAESKIIKIRWCDNLTQPIRSPDFPEILLKLLQKNREIRNRTQEKEVFSP